MDQSTTPADRIVARPDGTVQVQPASAATGDYGPGPLARPTKLSAAVLPFAPQPAVRWMSPGVLLGSGLRTAVTSAFGSFLDKRELQAHLDSDLPTEYRDLPEVWLDYLADTGDGFDETYTVASTVARRSLEVEGVDGPMPRGAILVLGGDEVYPTATAVDYENRLEGPFRAALPWTARDHPTLYALPGNHDWYDGLTGFLRLFGQGKWIGGWRTEQARSYFAVELPHRWWLWGIDVALDMYVDTPQLAYFRQVLRSMREGDRLILATAAPSWVELETREDACRNLTYVERTLVRPHGIDLRLTVAGDWHHYARYTSDDDPPRHKITAGGGGAFLHPTHSLPETIDMVVDPQRPAEVDHYRLHEEPYPDRRRSRRLAAWALLLPVRNPAFLWVPALLNVWLLWTNQFGMRSLSEDETSVAGAAKAAAWLDLALGLVRNPATAVTAFLLLLGLITFAKPPPWARSRGVRVGFRLAFGTLHTALQLALVVTVARVAVEIASFADGGWFVAMATGVDAAVGAVAGSVAVGAYLVATNVAPGLRAHANETFSAARINRHKNFLRLHIDRDGRLTVRALGLDRVTTRWRPAPDAEDHETPWFLPAGDPPRLRLIDEVVIE